MAKILFKNAHLVVDDKREFIEGAILVDGERIVDVFPHANKLKEFPDTAIIDLKGAIVFPGFFDTHTHGRGGIDFNSCSREELEKASLSYALSGTTSFLATLTKDEGQIIALKDGDPAYARFQGIHLEGPFINSNRKGAIEEKQLRKPDFSYVAPYSDIVRQMTLAPELEGSKGLIQELKNCGIRVMVGHSEISKEELKDLDYDGYTHLFNAMPPLSHRGGSILNVALDNDDHYVELIADGQHIDLSVVEMALKLLDHKKIILISDSTLAAGLKDGDYPFLNEICRKKGMTFKRISDGRFAGGVSSLLDQLKLLKHLRVSNTDLLAMTSLNAFRFYGLDRQYGSLVKGKYADLVILNKDFDLIFTYVKGKIVHV